MIEFLAILQARMNSSRLPGKIMLNLNGAPMISRQIARIKKSKLISELIVATSSDKSDDILADFLTSIGVDFIRGDMDDVLSRFISIIDLKKPKAIIRLTADCPLVMPELIDVMISEFRKHQPDYLSNTLQPTFPDGLDIEIVSSEALNKLCKLSLTSAEKEHVTLGIYSRPSEFSLLNFRSSNNLEQERWTVDYMDDYIFISEIYKHFQGKEDEFNFTDVLKLIKDQPILKNKLGNEFRNISLRIEGNIE